MIYIQILCLLPWVTVIQCSVSFENRISKELDRFSRRVIKSVDCESESDPMRRMACKISFPKCLGMSAWTEFEGSHMLRASSGLDTREKWSFLKAAVILASRIVDCLPTRESQKRFLDTTLLPVYAKSVQSQIMRWFVSEYPRDKDFRPMKQSVVFEQLVRAPMWRIDAVAPSLDSVEVKRVQIQHQLIRNMLKPGRGPHVFKVDDDFHKSVKHAILQMSPDQVRRSALVGWFVVAWTLTYLKDVLPVQDGIVVLDPEMSRAELVVVGRILGLMFVRGIRLKNIAFPLDFYDVLSGSLSSNTAYTIIKKEFWRVVEVPLVLSSSEIAFMISQ